MVSTLMPVLRPASDLERYEHYVITHSRMQGTPDGDNAESLLNR